MTKDGGILCYLIATQTPGPPPMLRARDAPGLVPRMAHEGDITRGARPPRAPRRAPAPRQDRANAGDAIVDIPKARRTSKVDSS